MNSPYPGEPGAWIVYDQDRGPYAIALHDNVMEAARDVARRGYGKVGFWPFGTELSDAVARWEAPASAETRETTATGVERLAVGQATCGPDGCKECGR